MKLAFNLGHILYAVKKSKLYPRLKWRLNRKSKKNNSLEELLEILNLHKL